MVDITPGPENNYQASPTLTFSRAVWNAVMASIAARLKARELLEASFETMIANGTQAALDMISQNVAPQLEDLIEQINALEAQLEEIIGGGTAANSLQLGGQNPSYYLALANATGSLPVAQVSGVDALIAAAVAGLVNSAPATLDTLKELSDALGGDANFAASVASALGGKQPLDATLTALAGLTTAANKLIFATGADTFATSDLTAFARSILAAADAAAMRTTIGAQPLDATLTALTGVTVAANKLIYATGADAFAAADLTAFARSILDDADAPAVRATIGGEYVISRAQVAGAAVVDFTLPAGFDSFEIIASELQCAMSRPLSLRLSVDGSTFVDGASDYTKTLLYGGGAGAGAGASTGSFLDGLSPAGHVSPTALRGFSKIDLYPGSAGVYPIIGWVGYGFSPSLTSHQPIVGSGHCSGIVSRAQAVRLFVEGGQLFDGTFILKGRKA